MRQKKKTSRSHEELHSKVEYIVAHGISTTLEDKMGDKKAVIGSAHFVLRMKNVPFPKADRKYLMLLRRNTRICIWPSTVNWLLSSASDPLRSPASYHCFLKRGESGYQ